MANQIFIGNAAAIAQVANLTVGGTPQLPAPSAPSLSAVTGTSNAAAVFVVTTYLNGSGQTLPSAESTLTPTSAQQVQVASPAAQGTGAGAAGAYNVYVGTVTGGPYYLQNSSPVSIGTSYTIPGTPGGSGSQPPTSNTAAGMTYSVAIGYGAGKTITYTSTVTDTNASIATSLQVLLGATLFPEFREILWTNPSAGIITATALTAGVPFTLMPTATGSGTLTQTTIVGSSGPNDVGIAANWSTGRLPATGDNIYFQSSTLSAMYELDALAAVTPANVYFDANYTGVCGLPVNNPNGYREYRPRYLQFNGVSGNVFIGQGQGQGSGKIQLDFQTGTFALIVWKTATSTEIGLPAVQLKGGSTSSTVNVNRGSVGLALLAGETAACTLTADYVNNQSSDAQIWAGPGVTLENTTAMSGGQLIAYCAVPAINLTGAQAQVLNGDMTSATLNYGGAQAPPSVLKYAPPNGGTITTYSVANNCILDCSGTLETVTLTGTSSTLYAGATINAAANNVVMTNAVPVADGQASDVTLHLGAGRKVQVI